jgi:pimeloyl-ACP methyl ester carboxylesterase
MATRSADGVSIPVDDVTLPGELILPRDATGLVAFAHGSGSSHKSPRNTFVADVLRDHGLGTLLFDLLTEAEDRDYRRRFDVDRLTRRLLGATTWLRGRDRTRDVSLGYFGSSTGAAAALNAAARRPEDVGALVSRGGRVDLASDALSGVTAPTLFVVGGADHAVLELNRLAYAALACRKDLQVVEGAGHLFEGPGELEAVAELAADWFARHLR